MSGLTLVLNDKVLQRAEICQTQEFSDARDDTFRQIRRLSEEALVADERIRLFEDRILPRAKRTLQLSSADYRGQLVDFGEVVDYFSKVLMLELQAARSEATLAGSLAQIERAVGCEVAAAPRQLSNIHLNGSMGAATCRFHGKPASDRMATSEVGVVLRAVA